MIRLLSYFFKSIVLKFRKICLNLKVYRIHGVYLPEGAGIYYPEHITIGKNFRIEPHCKLFCQDPKIGSELIIGDNVGFHHNALIIADMGKIHIGNNVLVGPYAIMRSANHKFKDRTKLVSEQGHDSGCITIEDDVWLGARVTVLPNVTLGKGAVIGAGSVVTKDVPPYAVAVGNPARVIGSRGE